MGEKISHLIYAFFSLYVSLVHLSLGLFCYFLVCIGVWRDICLCFTCENVLFSPPGPENKLNGQIILVFCLKQFLVEVSFSLTTNLLYQRKTLLGKGAPGRLNHICLDSLGSEPEMPAPCRDHGALSFPPYSSLFFKAPFSFSFSFPFL